MTPQYEELIKIIKGRRSTRRLRTDPIPDEAVEKILEAGRWAMSGANGQPWEFIVVKDAKLKHDLNRAYQEELIDYNFWMEQMRAPDMRHPAYMLSGTLEDQLKIYQEQSHNLSEAPVVIAVVGDGRRQWATVMGGHTMGRHQSHLTDGLANACTLMHLAAHALGLGSQWVTIQIEDRFKKILNLPDVMMVHSLMPVGYAAGAPKQGVRRPLEELVHYDQYNRDRYISNRQVLDYVRDLRKRTVSIYKGKNA